MKEAEHDLFCWGLIAEATTDILILPIREDFQGYLKIKAQIRLLGHTKLCY